MGVVGGSVGGIIRVVVVVVVGGGCYVLMMRVCTIVVGVVGVGWKRRGEIVGGAVGGGVVAVVVGVEHCRRCLMLYCNAMGVGCCTNK